MEHELKSSQKLTRSRKQVALHLADYEQHLKNRSTQREASAALGVPRTTLQHWKARKESIPIAESVINCLESADGADFLHRLVTALEFVMTEVGGCGIRLVSLVLELSHLTHFVAGSYETLRRRNIDLENYILAFGDEEQRCRSEDMPMKKISVAQDETFHPKTCLVAIEPVSNFILLEKYSEKRDTASWNSAMNSALSGLNVEVIQSTSDEAKGIVSHVEKNLGAHHSPDIFHVQYEISKGCSATLASQMRQAEKILQEAQVNLQKLTQFDSSPSSGRGRKPDIFSQSLCAVEEQKINAENLVNQRKEQKQKFMDAKKMISADYHPYDLATGEARSAEDLGSSLNQRFDIIEKTAKDSGVKDNGLKKVEKAKRVLPALIETLTFYWSMVAVLLESLALTKSIKLIMTELLIPAEYLFLASKKGSDAESRKTILDASTDLTRRLEAKKEWQRLTEDEKNRLQAAAKEAAGYFQRSSSCVEGRNGYLSLRHHGFHHLSNRKLGALTTIHNYFIKRPDGTTAADRFFGGKGRDLFEYLLKKMPYPGRSGQRAKLLKNAA
jgi:hypothetical protein